MKTFFVAGLFVLFNFLSFQSRAQPGNTAKIKHSTNRHLFMDVHQLQPGKVKLKDVEQAHIKDLALEDKYDVDILKYWFDEKNGKVYCLALAYDAESLQKTHAEAHGLIPSQIYRVTEGTEAELTGKLPLFLDVHYLGAGNVTAKDVAAAHVKDLAVQKKYGVNLINYWVDEKEGVVMCLAQAKDSNALIQTHKEAHGLIPASVSRVKQRN